MRGNISRITEKKSNIDYKALVDEDNRRRGLDPKKMIKGVDDLISRIDRNFDKNGCLTIP